MVFGQDPSEEGCSIEMDLPCLLCGLFIIMAAWAKFPHYDFGRLVWLGHSGAVFHVAVPFGNPSIDWYCAPLQ